MAQTSNDSKGLTYVASDSGQILFRRNEVGASGQLVSGTIVVTGWVGQAGNAIDLYATVASGNGAVTLPTNSTATTGPAAG